MVIKEGIALIMGDLEVNGLSVLLELVSKRKAALATHKQTVYDRYRE